LVGIRHLNRLQNRQAGWGLPQSLCGWRVFRNPSRASLHPGFGIPPRAWCFGRFSRRRFWLQHGRFRSRYRRWVCLEWYL